MIVYDAHMGIRLDKWRANKFSLAAPKNLEVVRERLDSPRLLGIAAFRPMRGFAMDGAVNQPHDAGAPAVPAPPRSMRCAVASLQARQIP
jgi:hypothetical protein